LNNKAFSGLFFLFPPEMEKKMQKRLDKRGKMEHYE
jgi:hypothetical protein